jgi:hypothetical protein
MTEDMKGRTMLAVAAAIVIEGSALAADWYISPKGSPEAAGTKEAPWDVGSVLRGRKPVRPGDTVWLLGGVYVLPADAKSKRFEIECRLTGTAEKPIIVRQAPGERATIDGSIQILGADAWYWGFEVRGTRDTDRAAGNHCINVHGPRTKMINMIVHRGAMGSGFWTPAVDAEQYGNLIFDFGSSAKDRGHGHACYTQNASGTKRIVDNVMFAGYGWNLHAYTQAGQITGYHVEGNFFFCSGMASPPSDAPKDNVIICAYAPGDRYVILRNVAYSPRTGGWRYNVRLSTYMKPPRTNRAAEVRDNYFMGYNGLALDRWLKMTATGNEIWAPMSLLTWQKAPGAKDEDWLVDHNVYHALADQKKFNGRTFAEHRKASGFDGSSRLVATTRGRPTGTRIFIRPNRYEPGRAHVAVFNWDGKDAVELDLAKAGLKRGQRFQVRNVLDLYGKPAAEGAYDGRPLRVAMMKSPIAPDFDAFLVVPAESFGCFQARGDEPRMDWTKWDWTKALAGAGKRLDQITARVVAVIRRHGSQ